MKKNIISFTVLVIWTVFAVNVYANSETQGTVSIRLISNEDGVPLCGEKFDIKIVKRSGGRLEVKSDDNGDIEIAASYIGIEIIVSSYRYTGGRAEVKAEGTVIKCSKTNPLPASMVNPWGHSRPSPPKVEAR